MGDFACADYNLHNRNKEDWMQNFNGDFDQLASTMQASWSENHEQPLLYSPEFLSSAFEQPGSTFDLAPALYDDSGLVAFGAAFPRTVNYAGKEWKLALDSFITVAKNQKGKGLGGKVWSEIARRTRDQGFDGLITFCVEGDRMCEALPRYSEQYEFNTQRVYSVQYLARPLPRQTAPKRMSTDTDVFLHCAKIAAQQSEFSRIFNPQEAKWQSHQRWGAFGTSLEAGGKRGAITAYAVPTAGAVHTMCGLIEDVLWHEFEATQRRELLDSLMTAAAAQKVELLLCPVLGYTDLEPLRVAGFRRTKRLLHMYLTSWRDDLPLHPLTSAYIDVF